MARIRSIKPEFPQSETIGRLSRDARLLFILLWTFVDDDGRARANSRMLASLLYPYDDDVPALIDGWLHELEDEGCVRRYQVDGTHYLDIPNWLKHQKIDRPTPSKFPPFDDGSPVTREPSRALAADLDMDLGGGKGVQATPEPRAREADPDPIPDEFDAEFWPEYPNKVGKPAALKAFRAARRRASLPAILAGLRRYKAWKPDDRQWLNPSTFLNQDRWADEPAKTPPPRAGPSNGYTALLRQYEGIDDDRTDHDDAFPTLDLRAAGSA